MYYEGKLNAYHLSSDDESIKGDVKKHNVRDDPIKEIDMLKKESKLSIDDVLDQLPKGYLEMRSNEKVNEVCLEKILF